MPIEVTRFETAAALRAAAEPFLMAHEAEHNLILGLIGRLERAPDFYPSTPYLAVVAKDGETVCAAMQTPPFPLVVSRCENEEALRPLAADAYAFNKETRGVNGPVAVAALFKDAWQAISGEAAERRLAERIYKLERIRFPTGVAGQARRARDEDMELLTDWQMAFTQEAHPWEAATREETRQVNASMVRISPLIAGMFVWEVEGRPVSMVGYSRPTLNSLCIAPVYTPPELRGRGYASACTAEVCRFILYSGKRLVTLYTDLANPTSNHIYQEVGFEPVSDVAVYSFGGR